MRGRRIEYDPSQNIVSQLTQPGDYLGPITGYHADSPGVFFLLPLTEAPDGHPEALALHSVRSPPHVFTEEPDGTLTIRESIGAGPGGNYYWHGYLTAGEWSVC